MPLVPDFDRVPVCSGTKTYSYDANGNMVQELAGGVLQRTFSYH